MSSKPKKSDAIPTPGSNAVPAAPKVRRPRKPKVEGPASRAVEKDGKVVALVLNSLSDQAAIEMVTGKYVARIVGISEGILMARDQDLPVLDQANYVAPSAQSFE